MENIEINDVIPNPENKNHDSQDQYTENDIFLKISSFIKSALNNKTISNIIRSIIVTMIMISSVLFLFIIFIYIIPALQELPSGGKAIVSNNADLRKNTDYRKQITLLERDIQRLSRKYNNYTPGQSYLVINTTDNQFYLYRNKKIIREGFCSSGSYKMLKTEEGRSWIFKTPKGKFWIQGKTTHPSWRRPDWSFVEEGSPIPPPNDPSRYEYGVLGDYALALGDGYLIHGTLYKRFLGMPVTHGCVRLNDEDLKAIYDNLSIGSKVYIY